MNIDKIPEAIEKYNEHVWIKFKQINGIFYYDLKKEKMESFTDRIEILDNYSAGCLMETDGKLITFPRYGNEIIIWNINKKNIIKKIILPVKYAYCDNAFLYDQKIFIVNNDIQNLCLFELDIKKLIIKDKITIDIDEKYDCNKNIRILSEDFIRNDNLIYMVAGHDILKIDILNKKVEKRFIESKIGDYVTICETGDGFLTTDEKGNCEKIEEYEVQKKWNIFEELDKIRLQMSLTERKQIENMPGYKESFMAFNNSFENNGKIYLVPGRASAVVTFDLKTNKWSSILEDEIVVNDEWGTPLKKKVRNSKCIFMKNNHILNIENEKIYKIIYDIKKIEIIFNNIILESDDFFNSMDCFLNNRIKII